MRTRSFSACWARWRFRANMFPTTRGILILLLAAPIIALGTWQPGLEWFGWIYALLVVAMFVADWRLAGPVKRFDTARIHDTKLSLGVRNPITISVRTSDPAVIGHRPLRQSLDQDHPPLAPSARTGRRPRQRILGLASYYRARSLSRHDPARRQAGLVLGLDVVSLDCRPDSRLGVEGRTIKNVEEMLEFCKAAVAAAHADPSAIRLHIPQDMRVAEITLADGRKVYDVLIDTW